MTGGRDERWVPTLMWVMGFGTIAKTYQTVRFRLYVKCTSVRKYVNNNTNVTNGIYSVT